jgi:hypothetical protein
VCVCVKWYVNNLFKKTDIEFEANEYENLWLAVKSRAVCTIMARDTNNDLFMNRIVYYSWSGDNTVVDFDDHQEFDNRISDENNEKVLKINNNAM